MKKNRVSIGLVNPKSPENVGSVMRAAGNYQVANVFYTGKRYPRALMRNINLPNMHRGVSKGVQLAESNSDFVDEAMNMDVVCVEFAENAIALPMFEHPEQVFYIFGPEDGSLSQDIINRADAVVYIPTVGCMNLAATVNVLLYDRLAKSKDAAGSEELISKSRDSNNRLKVSEFE